MKREEMTATVLLELESQLRSALTTTATLLDAVSLFAEQMQGLAGADPSTRHQLCARLRDTADRALVNVKRQQDGCAPLQATARQLATTLHQATSRGKTVQ